MRGPVALRRWVQAHPRLVDSCRIGMRERVEAVGGWLAAGCGQAGSFVVHARIPRGTT